MSNQKRPDFFEEVAATKARLLPEHCDNCREIANHIHESILRRRRMEDVAAAFAVVGLLCTLRATIGAIVEQDDNTVQRQATEHEIRWALHYIVTGIRHNALT